MIESGEEEQTTICRRRIDSEHVEYALSLHAGNGMHVHPNPHLRLDPSPHVSSPSRLSLERTKDPPSASLYVGVRSTNGVCPVCLSVRASGAQPSRGRRNSTAGQPRLASVGHAMHGVNGGIYHHR